MPGFDKEIARLAQRVLINPRPIDWHTGVLATKVCCNTSVCTPLSQAIRFRIGMTHLAGMQAVEAASAGVCVCGGGGKLLMGAPLLQVTPGVPGVTPVKIELTDFKTKAVTGELEVDAVLVATGRAPYTHGLNLAAVNAETDRRGFIPVDEKMQVPLRSLPPFCAQRAA